jgi:hypothetical protein
MSVEGLVVDEYGIVRAYGLHDAVLRGIEYAADDALILSWRSPANDDRWVQLLGVSSVGFKDVVNGMILSEVFCTNANSGLAAVGSAMDAWRVLMGGNVLERDLLTAVSRLIARHPHHLLVVFESSYGGTIAAICSELRVLEERPQSS